ncbi:MAG: peptidase, partial [Rufibacter sp.]
MLTNKTLLTLLLLVLVGTSAFAQQQLPMPRNIEAAYKKGTRSLNGAPGANYWQNTADYTIKIDFDPRTRRIAGTVDIDYSNNSPDTLKQIVFKLYPNLYQKGAPRANGISPKDVSEGVQIEKLSVNQEAQNVQKLRIDATNLTLRVKPIAPKQKAKFSIAYHYILNEESHMRTGQVDPQGAAFVAYFFPRIAVYDDVEGWNRTPYLGPQEFYNDFCRFNTEITVPKDFVVWATGDLTNASEVFTKKFAKRLADAEKKDAIVAIIDSTDLKKGNITAQNARNTWKFSAGNVIDFAFATSDHYLWNSTSLVVDPKTKRRTRVDVAFNPVHHDFV